MRIAYFGLPLAAWLLHRDGHEVSLVVLSPVTAPGERRVRAAIGPERVTSAGATSHDALASVIEERLARDRPELIVSWYWTRKLPLRWIERARLGGIGVHPSLLPRHRGPNPFFWAIDSGDAVTGVTVHALDAGYDTGDVLAIEPVAVGQRDAWQLARALDRPGLMLLRDVVRRIAQGTPPAATAQEDARSTWAPEPEGDTLRVDWSWPTERVLRRIRALSPVPGLALDLAGLAVFVTRAEATREYPEVLRAGEAAAWGEPARVVVRTGDGAVALTRAVMDDGSEEPAALTADALVRRFAARDVPEV